MNWSGEKAAPAINSGTLPGPMLQRGFWLYLWRVPCSARLRLSLMNR